MKPYYSDDWNTIYHGDCMEILPQIETVDLVLTDPPYVVSAGRTGLLGDREYLKSIKKEKLTDGFDINILRDFKNWFCFCGKKQLFSFKEILEDKTWMLLTWNKTNPTPLTNNNYLPDTEYIFHCFSEGRLFGEYQDKSRFFISPNNGNNGFNHPTVKPTELIGKLINLGSQEGELILDPFMGSGTTLVASKYLRRKSIGIEIEEKYIETAIKRLRQEVLI